MSPMRILFGKTLRPRVALQLATRAIYERRDFMDVACLRRRDVRIAWVLLLALSALIAGLFAHRAYAAVQQVYTVDGNPTSGTVGPCYSSSQYCTIYPDSSIRTPGVAYRNWNDAWWYFPPWTVGGLVYTDAAGGWVASMTADAYTEQHPYMHMGIAMDNVKALCRNVGTATATNTFTCVTTTPG
jgi:hypothetical protein